MITKKQDNIEEVSLLSVKLWNDNPRINDAAVPKLMEILKVRGQVTPIVVWHKNMTIYKGNTTWKAIKKLGWPKIKVLFVDFPSEQAAIAYGIADNKSSEWSQWDDSVLLRFMDNREIVTNSGFNEVEVKNLFEPLINKEKEIGELETEHECPKCGYRY
jgi:ParB-like chromosome segregation protein Spo0J